MGVPRRAGGPWGGMGPGVYGECVLHSELLGGGQGFSFIDLFLEGKGGRNRGRKTSMCGCLLCAPCWDLAHNPGMCPDWELNWRPFGLQARTYRIFQTIRYTFSSQIWRKMGVRLIVQM